MKTATSFSLLSMLVACADSTPPSWPADGELEATEIETYSAVIQWPAATDDEAVEHYIVKRDGEEVARLPGSTSEVRLDRLEDGKEYGVTVLAEDGAHNPSEPLHVSFTTLDGSPPSWPAGSHVVAIPNAEATRINVSWDEADDNIGVVRYELHLDGEPVAQTAGPDTSWELEGAPGIVSVFAVDERGNTSDPILSTEDAAAPEAPEEGEPIVNAALDDDPNGAAPVQIQLNPALRRALEGAASGRMIRPNLKVAPNLQLNR